MLQGMGCLSWYAFLVASILSNELHHVNYLARYVNVFFFFLCMYMYIYFSFEFLLPYIGAVSDLIMTFAQFFTSDTYQSD